MAKKSSSQLIVLSLLAIVSLALYLGYNLPNRWQYALENRALSLIAIVITGAAIALATMIFQTVVNNRILTPSILGLDSLYLLIQTTIIFLFGSSTLLSMNSISNKEKTMQKTITCALTALMAVSALSLPV